MRRKGRLREEDDDDRIFGFLTERNYLEALTPVNAIEEEEKEVEVEVVEEEK